MCDLDRFSKIQSHIATQSSMIPIVKGKKVKGIIKVNHRLALQLQKEVISTQAVKKVQP